MVCLSAFLDMYPEEKGTLFQSVPNIFHFLTGI